MGAYHLPELAGQNDALVERIPILRISAIQPDQFLRGMHERDGF